MQTCAGGVKFDMRGECPECGSSTKGPCWRDYGRAIKIEAVARTEYARHEKDAKLANFEQCGCDFCGGIRANSSQP